MSATPVAFPVPRRVPIKASGVLTSICRIPPMITKAGPALDPSPEKIPYNPPVVTWSANTGRSGCGQEVTPDCGLSAGPA